MSRSYCGLYVDAGYLEHAAATRLTGSSYRSGIVVDHARLIEGLVGQVTQYSGLPLLRVHWYDGAAERGNTASSAQKRIGLLPHVKIRLGRRNTDGDQKGVDVRIGLDIATHSRMSNVDVIYLLSGDDDLTEAVEEAQAHGAQVIVLAVPGKHGQPHGMAEHLEQEADGIALVATELLDQCVRVAKAPATTGLSEPPRPAPLKGIEPPRPAPLKGIEPPRPAPPKGVPAVASGSAPMLSPSRPVSSDAVYSSTTGGPTHVAPQVNGEDISDADIQAVCENVVRAWATSSSPEDWRSVRAAQPNIAPELDRALLVDLSDKAGTYDLDFATKVRLRATFWKVLDAQAQVE